MISVFALALLSLTTPPESRGSAPQEELLRHRIEAALGIDKKREEARRWRTDADEITVETHLLNPFGFAPRDASWPASEAGAPTSTSLTWLQASEVLDVLVATEPRDGACRDAIHETPKSTLAAACLYYLGTQLWRARAADAAVVFWRHARDHSTGIATGIAAGSLHRVGVVNRRFDIVLENTRSSPSKLDGGPCGGINSGVVADCFLMLRTEKESRRTGQASPVPREALGFCQVALDRQASIGDCALSRRIRARASEEFKDLSSD